MLAEWRSTAVSGSRDRALVFRRPGHRADSVYRWPGCHPGGREHRPSVDMGGHACRGRAPVPRPGPTNRRPQFGPGMARLRRPRCTDGTVIRHPGEATITVRPCVRASGGRAIRPRSPWLWLPSPRVGRLRHVSIGPGGRPTPGLTSDVPSAKARPAQTAKQVGRMPHLSCDCFLQTGALRRRNGNAC